MADNSNTTNQLNKAVEQVQTTNSEASEQQQQQVQQSTTTTVATGAEQLQAQIAEAALSNESSAQSGQSAAEENADAEGSSGGSAASSTAESALQSSGAVGGDAASDISQAAPVSDDVPAAQSDIGASDIGGNAANDSVDQSAGGSAAQGAAGVSAGAASGASSSASDDSGEDFDTSSSSNTFQVDVTDDVSNLPGGDDKPLEGGEEDFDTETSETTIEITVTPENDSATANPIDLTMEEDGTILITQETLLTTASDVDGDDLTAQNLILNQPDQGTLTDNGDGTYSFAPAENFNGNLDFSYDVFDGTESTANTLNMTVTPVNDDPATSDKEFSMNEDGTITFSDASLLTDATDVDGDVISISEVSYSGTDGIFTNNGDGTYTFAPNENFNGAIEGLSYTVKDDQGGFNTAGIKLNVEAVNDVPVAGDTSYSVDEDSVIHITPEQLLANSSDVEGPVSIDSVSYSGTNGILTANDDGSFSFAPNENFYGDLALDVVVIDNEGATDTATASIDVLPINDPPVSGDLAYNINEDGSITLSQEQLLSQASDVEGDDLFAYNLVSNDEGLSITDNGDGTFTLTPDANFSGEFDISFDVTDGEDSVSANIDLTVNPINDMPYALDKSFSMEEDGTIVISEAQLLAGAGDVEGPVSIDSVSYTGDDGVFVDNGDGTYTFSPNENFNGDVDLSYTVIDNEGARTTADIDIAVTPVNDPPIAGNTSYTMDEDSVITLSAEQLLANASDIEGDVTLHFVAYNGPDGVLSDNGDGTFSFAPNENFNGNIEIGVVVADSEGSVDTGSASIDVLPINDPPVSGDLAYVVNEDGSIILSQEQLLSQASDVEGDDLTASNLQTDNDSLEITDNGDGTFTLTPAENFNGDLDITFDVSDGTDVVSANIDLTVNPINDLPFALDKSFDMQEDGTIIITDDQLLAGAGDLEGEVSVADVSYDGTDGVFTDNGDGTYTFAPNENFNGNVDLSYSVEDSEGASVDADIDIFVAPINDPPVSGDLAYAINEDGSITLSQEQLLSQASDVEGDALSASNLQTDNEALTIVDNGDGTFTLTPEDNFNGDLDITFDISDGTDLVSANIDLTVNPVNDLPTAQDQSFTMNEDGTITITDSQLLDGASDIEGGVSISDVSYTGTDGVFVDNGDGTYTFSPNENFNGDVEMSFTVADEQGGTVDQSIDINVVPVNDPPIAGDTTYSMNEDSVIMLSSEQLLANSSDVEGDVTLQDVSYSGADGILTDNGDGTFSFAPNENFNGDVSLDITVVDSEGATDTATAGIDVLPINDPPVSGDLAYAINEDGSITLSQEQLLSQASDVDGDDLTALNLQTDNEALTITDNGDGTFTLTPEDNFNGDLDITFDVSDGAETVGANIDLTVNPVNDLPIAQDQSFTMNEDGTITITDAQLLDGASDIEGDVSIADVSYTGTDGVFTDNGDGTYTFSPNENFNGDVAMSFTVTDEQGATVDQSIDINVVAVNDPPIAGTTSYSMDEDSVITLSPEQLLAGASDIEGGVSLQSVSYSGTDGILTANDDGSFSFAPNENFNGNVSLDVIVVDGEGATVETTAGIDVLPINDPPVSGDLAYAINEDGSITLSQEQLLSQASDVEGDALSASNLQTDNEALTIVDNGDGTFTLTPEANFNGDLDITFDISDGTDLVSANIDLTVNPVNDLPTAEDKSFTMNEDGTITITDAQLLDGASDIEGGVSISDVSYTGTDGVFVDNGDGTYTFAPNENFNGDVAMTFTVADEQGSSVQQDLDINVVPVNDPPVAGSASYSMDEDSVITLSPEQLLAGASDIEGEVSLQSVSYSGTDGILSQNPDGTFSFAPNQDFNGDIALDVVVVDSEGATAETTAGIDVLPINDPPVSGDLAYTINEDGSITLSQEQLLSQASDVDGDNLTALNLQTENDSLIIINNGDDTFTLVPEANFNGDLDITFDVTDGIETVGANIDLTVNPVNDSPIATDDYTIAAGPGAIRLDSELEFGVMQYQTLDGNWNDMEVGVEYPADTEVQYVANDGETDNLMDVQIGTFDPEDPTAEASDWGTVSDGIATFTQGDMTVTTSMNNGPIASYNSQSTHVGLGIGDDEHNGLSQDDVMSVQISGEEVNHVSFELSGLGGWFDAESNQATQVVIRAYDADGNLIDSQGGFRESGELEDTYSFTTDQPVATFELGTVGGKGQFVVKNMTISRVKTEDIQITSIQPDGSAMSNSTALNLSENMDDSVNLTDELVEILPGPTELPITAIEDGVLTLTPGSLLNNDFDIDGDAISILEVNATENTHGTVELDENGNIVFTPEPDYNGPASFTYTITDEEGLTDTATVYLTVAPSNDPPAAEDKVFDVNEDQTITFTDADLLEGSFDLDGDVLSVADVGYSGTDGVLVDNGDGTYTFSPNENFSGQVDLTYSVSDGTNTTQADIDINVAEVNDPPIAGSTSYTMNEDSVITITEDQLLANSTDPEIGVRLEDVSYSGTDGILTDNGDGTFSFAPNENFNGDINLNVTISDGELSDTTTANIDVLPVNDPPVSGDLAYAINEDGSITLSQEQLLSQASDVDGDDLTALNLQTENEALTITDNGDGTFTLTPEANFNGDLDIKFDVTDGAETVEANIDLTVNPVNDLPTAQDQSFTMNEDGTITITDAQLLEGASDIEGGVSIADVSYTGTDGVFVDNGDGSYTFSPNENFNGDVAMSFTVADEQGGTVDQSIDINVVAVNDPPIAGDTTYSMNEDSVITLSSEQLLANSSDIEGEVTLQDVSYSGTDGILTDNGDGTFSFSPNENFNGDVSLDITVVDNEGATDTATAGIDVLPINDPPVSGDLAYTINEDESITLNQSQLLSMASDVEGDDLTAMNLRTDNDTLTITDNGDGTFTLTPDENFNGDLDIAFDVSDGTDITTANIDLAVTPVNDAPDAPTMQLGGEEDQVLVIDPAFITSQINDVDGDTITLENLTIRQPDNASLSQMSDGMYHLVGAQDFNGLIELDYTVSDGTAEVSGSLNVDMIPVNDAPFANGNASLTTFEDGEISFSAEDMIDLFGDVDIGDTLSIASIQTAEGEDGGDIRDNGDGTFTFVPTDDFAGTAGLRVVVEDEAGEQASIEVPVFIRPVADGAVITTDHEGPLVFGEDSTGHLGLNVNMLDDSEFISNMAITGFPVGFTVTDGENTIEITEVGQMLDVTEWSVDDLQLTPPEDYNGTFFLTVTTTTADYGDEGSVPNDVAAENFDFDIPAGESIVFTTEDLFGIADHVEPQEGDDIGLIHLIDRSQGEMIDNGDGTYTFNPAEGFDGMVDFAFVIDRGDEMIDVQSTIKVEAPEPEPASGNVEAVFAQNSDGSVQMTADQLLADMDLGDGNIADFNISDVSYSGDGGTLLNNGDDTWTFWPSPDYDGNVDLSVTASNGDETVTGDVGFPVESSVSDESESGDSADQQAVSDADYSAAPGDTLTIAIPDDIAANDNVDHVVISDLPDGASIDGALENADGDYVVSGDLSQPVSVNLGSEFEGETNIQVTGFDNADNAVEGASETLSVAVDSEFAMDGSSADQANDNVTLDEAANDGWTSSDGGADQGVDIMDDSNLNDIDTDQSGQNDYSDVQDIV